MTYDANVAHPKIDYLGSYPNLQVTQGADGSQTIRSLEPGNESYWEIQPSGSYRGYGANGQTVEVNTGKKHEYNADGHSMVIDGQSDYKVSGNHRFNVAGDHHIEAGGGIYSGANGNIINTAKGNIITSSTGGDIRNIAEGNWIDQIKGDASRVVSGHAVEQVTGSKTVTSVADMVFNSKASITLQCGQCSITITPNEIYIVGPNIINTSAADNFVLLSGEVITAQAGSQMNLTSGSVTNITSPDVEFRS